MAVNPPADHDDKDGLTIFEFGDDLLDGLAERLKGKLVPAGDPPANPPTALPASPPANPPATPPAGDPPTKKDQRTRTFRFVRSKPKEN